MYQKIRQHAPQFLTYLFSGGSAAAIELTSYKLMLWSGVWYLYAAFLSGMFGLVSAFFLHKFLVFKKKEQTSKQLVRYIMLQSANFLAQVGLVYAFVTFMGVDPFIAKIMGIGCTVMWNFFLYKFFVYA